MPPALRRHCSSIARAMRVRKIAPSKDPGCLRSYRDKASQLPTREIEVEDPSVALTTRSCMTTISTRMAVM